MKRMFAIASAVVLAAILCTVPGRAQLQTGETPRLSVAVLMQQKLKSSQAILKGLAMEDYGLIEQESRCLSLLSLESGWNILQTKDYTHMSVEFREACEQIRSAAEDKNLDGVGLGYFKLTMTCIDCHRHIRNVKR